MAQLPYGAVPEAEPFQHVLARETAPDDLQHIQTEAGMFGGHQAQAEQFAAEQIGASQQRLAQGEQAFGAGALKAGQFLGQVAADDAYNKFSDQVNHLLTGDPTKVNPDGTPADGYLGMRGADAVQKRAGVEQQINDLMKRTRESLSTPDQQFQFDQNSRRFRTLMAEKIGMHWEQQSHEYAQSVNKNTIASNLALIAADPYNDNLASSLSENVVGAFVKNSHLANGESADPAFATQAGIEANREVAKTRALAMAAKDPQGAMGFIDKNKALLGQEYPVLVDHVRARAQGMEVLGIVNTTIADAHQQSGTTGTYQRRDPSKPYVGPVAPNGITAPAPVGSFEDELIKRESGGRPGEVTAAKTQSGETRYYHGLFQMGPDEMRSSGVYDGDENDASRTLAGHFNLPSGQYTYEQFMASPQAQKEAFAQYKQWRTNNINRMGLDQYIGQQDPLHPDVTITAEGLFAGAHLGGEGGLKAYLESNGKENRKDSLGTHVGDYVAKFSKPQPATNAEYLRQHGDEIVESAVNEATAKGLDPMMVQYVRSETQSRISGEISRIEKSYKADNDAVFRYIETNYMAKGEPPPSLETLRQIPQVGGAINRIMFQQPHMMEQFRNYIHNAQTYGHTKNEGYGTDYYKYFQDKAAGKIKDSSELIGKVGTPGLTDSGFRRLFADETVEVSHYHNYLMSAAGKAIIGNREMGDIPYPEGHVKVSAFAVAADNLVDEQRAQKKTWVEIYDPDNKNGVYSLLKPGAGFSPSQEERTAALLRGQPSSTGAEAPQDNGLIIEPNFLQRNAFGARPRPNTDAIDMNAIKAAKTPEERGAAVAKVRERLQAIVAAARPEIRANIQQQLLQWAVANGVAAR